MQSMIRSLESIPGTWTELLPRLGLARRTAPSSFEAVVYHPLVCLILQGRKRIQVAGQEVLVEAGQCIVVSHAVPIASRIEQARPDAPYLSLVCRLDLAELRRLSQQVPAAEDRADARGFAIATAPPALIELFERYLALRADPHDAAVLEPLLRQELHYRLLRSPVGAMLRQLLRRDSHASHIHRAIEQLHQGYRRRIEMDALARSVGMSTSSFYQHFKTVTATTPLQYQKDLRLTEARRILLGGDRSVAETAHAVGYESASQFSREYRRRFGEPPSHALQATG